MKRTREWAAIPATIAALLNEDDLAVTTYRVVHDIVGDDKVEGLRLQSTLDASLETLPIGGVFIAIGHRPNTDLVKDVLDLDEHGYLKTEAGSTRTSLPGVFAGGDVQDSVYRQAITAAGTGAMAALDAERWLAEQEEADTTDVSDETSGLGRRQVA